MSSKDQLTYRALGAILQMDNLTPLPTPAVSETNARASSRTKMTLLAQIRAIIMSCWCFGPLLLLVPVGFALNYAHVSGTANFFVNFGAMIPLAGMLGFVADQLADHLGDILGGLLIATFG